MKYWCEHPWRGRFENARGEVCAKCGRPTDALYIDTATAIERFRNGQSISTPPRELQAVISNAIRATGELDDFEVTALVHAGVMKEGASPALPLPEGSRLRATLPDAPDRRPRLREVRTVSPARRHRISVGRRIRLTRKASPRRPLSGSSSSLRRASDASPPRPERAVRRLDAGGSRRRLAPRHHHQRRERPALVLGHRGSSPPVRLAAVNRALRRSPGRTRRAGDAGAEAPPRRLAATRSTGLSPAREVGRRAFGEPSVKAAGLMETEAPGGRCSAQAAILRTSALPARPGSMDVEEERRPGRCSTLTSPHR